MAHICVVLTESTGREQKVPCMQLGSRKSNYQPERGLCFPIGVCRRGFTYTTSGFLPYGLNKLPSLSTYEGIVSDTLSVARHPSTEGTEIIDITFRFHIFQDAANIDIHKEGQCVATPSHCIKLNPSDMRPVILHNFESVGTMLINI